MHANLEDSAVTRTNLGPTTGYDKLCCPRSGQRLHEERRSTNAESPLGPWVQAPRLPPDGTWRHDLTEQLLVRQDNKVAFPLTDKGIAILLWPEALFRQSIVDDFDPIDIGRPQYAEAYAEMTFYNRTARDSIGNIDQSPAWHSLTAITDSSGRARFLEYENRWLTATHDSGAQRMAYRHLATVDSLDTVQLGGWGTDAIKFALAGAKTACIVSPIPGELEYAAAMAQKVGVSSRMVFVAGVSEELPLIDGSVDRIYCGGTLHHMTTELAFPEASRILSPGGRFAAIDPWRATFYSIGIRVFGKREPEVRCRPLDRSRLRTLSKSFAQSSISLHGGLSRYPILALSKLGLKIKPSTVRTIAAWDDRILLRLPHLRARLCSSVAILGSKSKDAHDRVLDQ